LSTARLSSFILLTMDELGVESLRKGVQKSARSAKS
jgi:hypothetical protein